jgi:hypothetical protein
MDGGDVIWINTAVTIYGRYIYISNTYNSSDEMLIAKVYDNIAAEELKGENVI